MSPNFKFRILTDPLGSSNTFENIGFQANMRFGFKNLINFTLLFLSKIITSISSFNKNVWTPKRVRKNTPVFLNLISPTDFSIKLSFLIGRFNLFSFDKLTSTQLLYKTSSF